MKLIIELEVLDEAEATQIAEVVEKLKGCVLRLRSGEYEGPAAGPD